MVVVVVVVVGLVERRVVEKFPWFTLFSFCVCSGNWVGVGVGVGVFEGAEGVGVEPNKPPLGVGVEEENIVLCCRGNRYGVYIG